MEKTLSIMLGGDIYFQVDGDYIDTPIDLTPFNEWEGGVPMKFYGAILEWARENGITHIEDDNFVEMGIHNEPVLLSLQEYGDLIKGF